MASSPFRARTLWSTGTNEESLLEHQSRPGISYAWNNLILGFMIVYLGLSCATAGYSITEDCMSHEIRADGWTKSGCKRFSRGPCEAARSCLSIQYEEYKWNGVLQAWYDATESNGASLIYRRGAPQLKDFIIVF